MSVSINVLLIEDSDDDAKLVIRILQRGGFSPTYHRVQDAKSLELALEQHWDVIISDFQMPTFTGMDALDLCRRTGLDTPFILISGTIGEEIAVAAMKAGANDYVMKQNLARLIPALQRELQEAAIRATHRQIQHKLIESERRFNTFMDASPIVAWIKNEEGKYIYMNRAWDKTFNLHHEDWIGKTEFDLASLETAEKSRNHDMNTLKAGVPIETIDETGGANGQHCYWKSIRFPFLGEPKQNLIGGLSINITKEKEAEDTIHHLAYLDSLTLLPNRRLMLDRLKQAVASRARSQIHGALLFIDLDNFKTLNDTRGHDVGDLLLQQIGEKLITCTRSNDTVSRTGGDEFVVILEGLSLSVQEAASQAEVIGKKILAAINETYVLSGYEHQGTASIGITLFNDHRSSIEELMKRADLAMYRAKTAGRNTLRFFDPEMQAAVSARATLEADLRQGLQKEQFVLYYQPQVNCCGDLTGVEALLRLQHPIRGIILPTAFIKLAEETGLIQELGQWVLETACEQLVRWSANPKTALLTIAVNVSSRQFRHPDFVKQVLTILDCTSVNPNTLKLELTEGLLLDDIEATIKKMAALRARGVNFSLDDFGTGYSSLYYLKRLPLDQLKIDQSFVHDVLHDANDAAIICAILALGQSLGLKIIAEGVENESQKNFLALHGCSNYQGYLFGEPMSVDSLSIKYSI